jgi:hypothetical protein
MAAMATTKDSGAQFRSHHHHQTQTQTHSKHDNNAHAWWSSAHRPFQNQDFDNLKSSLIINLLKVNSNMFLEIRHDFWSIQPD